MSVPILINMENVELVELRKKKTRGATEIISFQRTKFAPDISFFLSIPRGLRRTILCTKIEQVMATGTSQ